MTRLIFDVSSIVWTGLLAGKDEEFGRKVEHEGKEVYVNSASHGYENAMNMVMGALRRFNAVPSQCILVVEGKSSKALRQGMFQGYKAGRDSRPIEAYDEFNKLKDMLVTALLDVGATSCTQDGIEGDDVIAYLAENLTGKRVVVTGDGDMAVLVAPKLVVHKASSVGMSVPGSIEAEDRGVHVWRRDELDANPYGPFPHKYITLYKALCGDKSDGYKGAYNFGEKAFLDLFCVFGESGLDAMIELIRLQKLEELQEDVGELKALQKIIDDAQSVSLCWKLAKLYPEKVNTMRKPLQWRPGMVKPLTRETDERLRPYAGNVRLIHAGNYDDAVKWAAEKLAESAQVGLDIETSTPPESDEWLMQGKEKEGNLGVDVFGSELTGLGLTFGNNGQYTFYFTVDHVETDTVKNLTSEQVRAFVATVPKGVPLVIQNVAFELPILYSAWGEAQKDNGWHGFLPEAHDTKILASYVNENVSSGLKQNSKLYLNYDQQTYAEVTTLVGKAGEMPKGGRLLEEAEYEPGLVQQKRQYKMNELTAQHVLSYGSDDPICTLALYNHYRIICEIENTWEVYKQVEIKPAYLTALAFVQGTPISMQRMLELEKADKVEYDKAWVVVRDYLLKNNWPGTVCPVYTEFTPAIIKEAVFLTTGEEFKTMVRTVSKFPPLLEEAGFDLMAAIVRNGDLAELNKLVASRFDGEPKLDINSPKQMQVLLYDLMKLPPRILNKPTDTEREKSPALVTAFGKFSKIRNGSSSATLSPEDMVLLRAKAKTDDTAIDFALAFDSEVVPVDVLKAVQIMKTTDTRSKMFYKPYRYVKHWKDGLVHAHVNQCAAVTRRYSSSGPNLTQLPKKGEGLMFREVYVPHEPDAAIISEDFNGQELRLMAGQSLDKNMMACYVGDKKKDIHSITASGAMIKKWGKEHVAAFAEKYGVKPDSAETTYDLFVKVRKDGDAADHKKADDLRKDAKNVNFAAQFDAMAPKLSEMLVMTLSDAQDFLDAKVAMFPDVETWKDKVRARVNSVGFETTMLGARRHLAHAILGQDSWAASKAGRQGPNYKIQGSAAEMTKLAMGRLWDSGVFFRLNARFIAPIHDELVSSVHRNDMVEFARIQHECMTQPYSNLPVPIVGSISLGINFGQQHETGEEFSEVAINKALKEIFGTADMT